MSRKRISTRDRVALFEREKGTCHMCGGLVHVGEAWDVSHEIPLALGGADDATNWRVAHRKCHRAHTATTDVPNIARAKRREGRHIGAKTPAGKIRSAGFAKAEKPRAIDKSALPPLGASELARRFR